MFGQQGQPGAKPQGGFTFGGAASGTTAGGGGFTFGGTGSSAGTGTSGFKLGTSTTASSTPASKPFSFGSGAASTPGSSFNFTGLSSSSTTTAATTSAVPTLSLGTSPGPKTSLFGAAPLGSTQPSGGGFTFGAGGISSTQVNPASSAATTSTTGASSKPSLFAAPAPQTAGSPSLRLAGTTTSAGQGFKLGTAAPTPATGLGSTGTSTGSFGLGLPKTTATSATIASNTSASSLSSLGSFGSAISSSKPATSVSLTAQTTAQTTASITATTTTASSTPQLSYKQLEEQINKWVSNLEDYERTFLDQAAQVNAWDRLLMENGEKITELNDNVESVKAEQKRLDEELDFILAQQQELEVLLKPLEEELQKRTTGPGQLQNADREREFTYGLAKDIDGQLKQMVGDLKSIIEHLNATGSTQQENNDPIIQVAKILNAHMSSLQWIDQNAALLQRKVDEVSGLSEIRRKEQERNFRLAFD